MEQSENRQKHPGNCRTDQTRRKNEESVKVLFASGDVGGARALLSVMAKCEESQLPFAVLDHGHISAELSARWQRIQPDQTQDMAALQSLFKREGIKLIVFASSVKDVTALRLARQAKTLGLSVIHVLDNWTSYRKRMETDGLETFTPDAYAVMDEYAMREAIKDGIEESILVVTGHPGLASLVEEHRSWCGRNHNKELTRLGFDSRKTMIVFISEPVELDQGASSDSPEYRGYTEKTVLRMFCEAATLFSDQIEIGLLAHPREEAEGLLDVWDRHRRNLKGGRLRVKCGRESLFLADGLAGMASLLLYEAWLLGKPVISLQPGLRNPSLRMLEKKEGILFVDSPDDVGSSLNAWISMVTSPWKAMPRQEMRIHEQAPENVLQLIKRYAFRKP